MQLNPKSQQGGAALIEGLIAILIFSIGLLGTAAFQTNMIKQTTAIQYRLHASLLINSAMGEMEADPTQIPCYTGGACPNSLKADAWFDKVAKMPGATAHAPDISTDANGVTTIILYWAVPKEKDAAGNAVVHSMRAQVASLTAE